MRRFLSLQAFHKVEAPVRGDEVLLAGPCQETESLAVRIGHLDRQSTDPTPSRHAVLHLAMRALVCASSFRIGEDANLLRLDDRGGTEVHVDAARGDQQIDLVRFRNKARPVQQVAQKDPRLCFDHGFYGRVDKPC